MSRFSIIVGIGLVSLCSVIGGSASAQVITAFDLASPINGNQQYGATIGVDFSVNSPIIVTALGAFDAAVPNTSVAHTLNGTIVTTIYNSVTQQPVPGLSATFTALSAGTLLGGHLFKPTGNITLPIGNYVVAFTSITNNDQNGNSYNPGFIPDTYNEAGNLISINKFNFRYNQPSSAGFNLFPTTVTPGQFNAGSFQFTTAATPEPGTLSLLAGLAVMGGSTLARRRRKVRVARLSR